MQPSRRTTVRIAVAVALVGGFVGFVSGPLAADDGPALSETSPAASTPSSAETEAGRTFPGLDPRTHRLEDGVLVADLTDGSTAVLSLDSGLQAHSEGVFERYEVPYGALVALDPRTGRVLAYVSHSSADPDAGDLVLDPGPPAASVFKIVTAAALMRAGVSAEEPVCFHGGASRLREHNLVDDPARDRRCADLGEAMGGSLNCVFGKLAARHLDPPTLERMASVFGFGEALPFDVATRISPAEVPAERLEFARTAAGFWHMHMSPLHGALVAATIANEGRMPRPTIVDQTIDSSGQVSYEATAQIHREVIPADVASTVGQMMRQTVRPRGTAHRHFFDRRGNAFLPGIEVAGKTGTLAGSEPYRGYTWFVGFAPADEPTIAVAALVVNEPRWRIKGAFAAREAMRYWLVERPRRARRLAREAAAAENAAALSATP